MKYFLAIILLTLIFAAGCAPEKKVFPDAGEDLLFEKYESWGPCQYEGACHSETVLYRSGKITYNGTEGVQVYSDQVDKIIKKIQETGIMHADCETDQVVVDYGATTKIHLNGKKEITFPGCEEKLKEIESLIPEQGE
ncbi:MAG: hypothetical protein COV47_06165 [Candidatus Diapherotrites archaeon CG11_big_fil_rev_8_21_14_0_20_37_9]|nr:MAG: hypothetical protein COV47_06165 [Candidatus Diapherotrites archaeon CG11_big_fil_rev_8_21_14_0_20_37_9]